MLNKRQLEMVFASLPEKYSLLAEILYFSAGRVSEVSNLKVNNIKRSLRRNHLLPPLAPVLCSKLSPEEHRKYCKRQVKAYLVPTHSDLSKLLQALRFLPPKHLQ